MAPTGREVIELGWNRTGHWEREELRKRHCARDAAGHRLVALDESELYTSSTYRPQTREPRVKSSSHTVTRKVGGDVSENSGNYSPLGFFPPILLIRFVVAGVKMFFISSM